MKVNVIMGAYNAEKTIARSIDSILFQNYTDWKLIICDDGSSDNTFNILKQYERDYSDKIIIIKNDQNMGLTFTLNHCLSIVDSEYIARMDADDISLPDRLIKQVEFLDNHPEYAFVGCAIERFDENGVWKKNKVIPNPSKKVFLKSSGFVHPTIMIRKEVMDIMNGYMDRWYTNRCEDYDLWMRLYAKGFKGYNLDQVLLQYYEGKNSFPNRKYKYRIGEAITRAKGYANLGLLPRGLIYIFKPLVAGLLPPRLVKYIHKTRD